MTVGVKAESICEKGGGRGVLPSSRRDGASWRCACVNVMVRYMYAALPHANVIPCAAPIGTMLVSQNWLLIFAGV